MTILTTSSALPQPLPDSHTLLLVAERRIAVRRLWNATEHWRDAFARRAADPVGHTRAWAAMKSAEAEYAAIEMRRRAVLPTSTWSEWVAVAVA